MNKCKNCDGKNVVVECFCKIFYLVCKDCKNTTKDCKDEQTAIKEWNKQMYYDIVKFNTDITKDRRPTKAKQKHSLYRDSKSRPHRTYDGKGIVGKLFSKK